MGKDLLVRIFELGLYYDYNRVIDLYNFKTLIYYNGHAPVGDSGKRLAGLACGTACGWLAACWLC